jgi:hypothetical protein
MIKADDMIGEEVVRTPEQMEALMKAVEAFSEAQAEGEITKPLDPQAAQSEPEVVLEPHKRTPAEMVELEIAKQKFEKALPERSFSGRNPELGPMIKCAQCGLRHRDNVKHDPIVYKKDTTQSEHGRPVANPAGWRAKPGKLMWIKELKKFVTLTR